MNNFITRTNNTQVGSLTNMGIATTYGIHSVVNTMNTTDIHLTGPNPKIKTDRNVIDLDEAAETLEIVRERLLILVPAFEKHEKYPALKKAYEHYKLIEKIIQEESHERNG